MQAMNSAPVYRPMRAVLAVPAHHHALVWFLFFSVLAVAVYVSRDLRLLSAIYHADRSYLTSIIAFLLVLATIFCAWHIVKFSCQVAVAENYLSLSTELSYNTNLAETDANGLVDNFISEISTSTSAGTVTTNEDQWDSLVEIYADRLRSPVEFGWFLADLSIRLGLAGTIIGFILIFTSLSGASIDGADGLKQLLVTMSGGMGTALYTTLCGLVGATVLSAQFMILGRQVEYLTGLLIRLSLLERGKNQQRTADFVG